MADCIDECIANNLEFFARLKELSDKEGLQKMQLIHLLLIGSKGYTSDLYSQQMQSAVKGMNFKDVWGELKLKPPESCVVLNQLENMGYIRKLSARNTPHIKNKLKKEIILTKSGTDLYKRLREYLVI